MYNFGDQIYIWIEALTKEDVTKFPLSVPSMKTHAVTPCIKSKQVLNPTDADNINSIYKRKLFVADLNA